MQMHLEQQTNKLISSPTKTKSVKDRKEDRGRDPNLWVTRGTKGLVFTTQDCKRAEGDWIVDLFITINWILWLIEVGGQLLISKSSPFSTREEKRGVLNDEFPSRITLRKLQHNHKIQNVFLWIIVIKSTSSAQAQCTQFITILNNSKFVYFFFN